MKQALYRARFHLREHIPWAGFGPVHVDVELSGKCQLACVMCPYGTGEFNSGKQGMMSRELAIEAIAQARLLGASSLKLNFRGEPGLHPDLHWMIQYAKDLNFVEVAINTNLTAFSRRRLKEVADAGLDLMIVSIDGATRATYEAIRKKGDFQTLLSNITYVHALKKRPRIRVQMTVQDQNRHERRMMREMFGPFCDELVFQNVRQDNSGKRKRCPQPWQRLVVMWDGKVGACCSNWNGEAVIGDIRNNTLKQIWRSKAIKMLRRMASDPNRGDPCQTCKVGGSYK